MAADAATEVAVPVVSVMPAAVAFMPLSSASSVDAARRPEPLASEDSVARVLDLAASADAALSRARPPFWGQACAELAARDPVMRRLIDSPGPTHLASHGDPFRTLARSIVGQQISVLAAESVWRRMITLVGDLTPAVWLGQDTEGLRACGLSYRKIEYLNDLAVHFDSGAVDPGLWDRLDDEQIIAELTGVRGIGRWTVEMFLIFNLLRPDVYPLDDIGLLKALGAAYGEGGKVSRARAIQMGEAWRPWRSVATWYLWRSFDPVSVEY